MKRFVLFALMLFALAPAAGAACLSTGIQVDNSSATDTIYFYDQSRRFDATYLWASLDESAAGTVTMRRGIRASGGGITLIDDAVTYDPGEPLRSTDRSIYCLVITKSSATDELIYAASTCELTEIGPGFGPLTSYLALPTPVTVTTHSLATGITMESGVAGSATNLKSGRRTFPVTALPNVDGAKALELVISWSNFEHGGFRVEHIFSNSATDTTAYYFDGTSFADTVAVTDSSEVWGAKCGIANTDAATAASFEPAPDVAGSIVLRVPVVPGAGYYACRVYPWGTAHANWIVGLSFQLRVVQ